ncbi:nitroreductase [Magnetococcus sp. PR-3]|uniref:nitroreductase n=1 Tax=Magnetococcus sp. PR-3 TaxID=3120355 RepID=UPI002FCDF213
MHVVEAVKNRRAIRQFQEKPVPQALLETLLDTARWAPSGVNTQPWQVAMVQGQAQQDLFQAVLNAVDEEQPAKPDYQYYPSQWMEPYKGRRKACGLALYQALEIGREDKDKQRDAWRANYRFFDAPVSVFMFMDKNMGQGSWIDMGMFWQSLMLTAMAHGLGTCPMASVADYPDLVRSQIGYDENMILLGGLALGYPDEEAAVNQYRTTREPISHFATFHS